MVAKDYSITLEVAGPTAMWTRPDTGDAPVSYPAPTFSAAKGIFESIVWLKNVEVVPTKVASWLRRSSTRRRRIKTVPCCDFADFFWFFRFWMQTAFPKDGTTACAYYIGAACT